MNGPSFTDLIINMMKATDKELREMARAMWNEECIRATGRNRNIGWHEVADKERAKWVGLAESAAKAARAAGFVIVPIEPTLDIGEAMYEAVERYTGFGDGPTIALTAYRAAIDKILEAGEQT